LEEFGKGKGKLANASEEGQGPRRAVEPMMMMMMMMMMRMMMRMNTKHEAPHCATSPFSCYFIPLLTTILLRILFSNTLSLCRMVGLVSINSNTTLKIYSYANYKNVRKYENRNI
jgi:hypothetical protein